MKEEDNNIMVKMFFLRGVGHRIVRPWLGWRIIPPEESKRALT